MLLPFCLKHTIILLHGHFVVKSSGVRISNATISANGESCWEDVWWSRPPERDHFWVPRFSFLAVTAMWQSCILLAQRRRKHLDKWISTKPVQKQKAETVITITRNKRVPSFPIRSSIQMSQPRALYSASPRCQTRCWVPLLWFNPHLLLTTTLDVGVLSVGRCTGNPTESLRLFTLPYSTANILLREVETESELFGGAPLGRTQRPRYWSLLNTLQGISPAGQQRRDHLQEAVVGGYS